MKRRPRDARGTQQRTRPRRSRAVLVIALAATGLFLLLFLRGGSRKVTAQPGAGGEAEGTAAGGGRTPAPPGAGAALAAPSGSEAPRPPAHAVREPAPPQPDEPYPYPPWSQPLTEGSDPSRTVAEDNPVDAASGVHAIMGPRLHVVHPPDPLVIDLQVLNKLGARLPVTSAVARFRADGTPIQSATWYEAPFADDGSGADLTAADRAYTATFRPSSDQQSALLEGGEHVFVEVAFDAPGGLGPRKYGFAMMYSRRPDATLNGKYSDTAAGGNLVVSAGVTASKAGRYRLIGSLYAGDGQTAIAFATATAAVSEGDGTVPLTFFGKVLNERGIDGPYELRYLMLFEQIREGVEVPGDTVDHAYTTAAYRAKSFSPDAYQPPPPDLPIVDMNSPSQQGKPPPLFQRPTR